MVRKIFKDLKLTGCEISLVFCENDEIASLNHQYLGRKGPTNVISFPMDDPHFDQTEGERGRTLGDVVVNVDRAVSDAEEAGIAPLSELAFLVIHGICHLAGYDHEGENAHRAPEMEEVETRLHEAHGPLILAEP